MIAAEVMGADTILDMKIVTMTATTRSMTDMRIEVSTEVIATTSEEDGGVPVPGPTRVLVDDLSWSVG